MRCFRHTLVDALVRSYTIEKAHVLDEDTTQMGFTHDQQVIEAFTADTPQESFADRVCPWCPDWRSEHRDPAACRHSIEV